MEIKTIFMNLNGLDSPVSKSICRLMIDKNLPVPCLLVHDGIDWGSGRIQALMGMEGNWISAIPAPVHPYLFAERLPDTGDICFPFREDVGKGIRRQDLEPVYLFVPVFALVRDLSMPFRPHLIDKGLSHFAERDK